MKVRILVRRKAILRNKKRVLQYQWSRKTRCSRILERSLLVERSSATPKRTLYSASCADPKLSLRIKPTAHSQFFTPELFGHVKGAFTGAIQPRQGKFREADRGTLFLDEIGDMPVEMQAKILRVLQDKVVAPVGGQASYNVNIRIVAATHQDLAQKV